MKHKDCAKIIHYSVLFQLLQEAEKLFRPINCINIFQPTPKTQKGNTSVLQNINVVIFVFKKHLWFLYLQITHQTCRNGLPYLPLPFPNVLASPALQQLLNISHQGIAPEVIPQTSNVLPYTYSISRLVCFIAPIIVHPILLGYHHLPERTFFKIKSPEPLQQEIFLL